MELKLYHYVHCPFCIRVRMVLGFLKIDYKSIVLSYNDEETPIKLTGKKMLPIMVFETKAMNESLDIMRELDRNNVLNLKNLEASLEFKDFDKLLGKLGTNVHNLAMPYWIYTQEFDEASRKYFCQKKEVKRGPFRDLVKKRNVFENDLLKDLSTIELKPFFQSESFTVYDILLASHLWGLYIVPEFRFPDNLNSYLQAVKQICRFNYHEDFWR